MRTIATDIFSVFDWRSVEVLRRNALSYMRNWRTAFLPPAMEPVVFFLAFGLGLGSHVGGISYAGVQVDYGTYVAPGLLAYTAFSTPFYEGLYSSYVRMFYQKTWDGILATQVELHHIAWGEILWCGLRGMINTAVVAVVLAVFRAAGAIHIASGYLLLSPIVAFLAGCAFGALALIFTALVPAIDHMNFPVFLIGVPLGLASNTYFPVPTDHPVVAAVVLVNPVSYLAETYRAWLVGGPWLGPCAGLALSGFGLLVISAVVSQRLLRRRVLE